MKRWVKSDFTIKLEPASNKLQESKNRCYYSIYWHGSLLAGGFPNKRWASSWLGDYLKKANALRKAAAEKGVAINDP